MYAHKKICDTVWSVHLLIPVGLHICVASSVLTVVPHPNILCIVSTYVHLPQDTFSELLVPVFSVDANRMKAVVCYSLAKCLSQFTDNRNGLLLKSSFITEEVARALTDHGYKYLSHFGYACPVQVRLMHGQYLGHACMYCTCPTVLEHLAAVADFSLLCHFFPSRYRMVICSQVCDQ